MRQLITIPMLHSSEVFRQGGTIIGEHTAQELTRIASNGNTSTRFWGLVDEKLSGLEIAKRPRIYTESNFVPPIDVEPGTYKPPEAILSTPEGRVITELLQRTGGIVELTEDPKSFRSHSSNSTRSWRRSQDSSRITSTT